MLFSLNKKKKILTHVTTQMNPEAIVPNELSQSHKNKYCMILLIRGTRIVKFLEKDYKMVVARSWGQEDRSCCLIGTVFQTQVKEFRMRMVVMAPQQGDLMPLNYALEIVKIVNFVICSSPKL